MQHGAWYVHEPCEGRVARIAFNQLLPVFEIGKLHLTFLPDDPAALILNEASHVPQSKEKMACSERLTGTDWT